MRKTPPKARRILFLNLLGYQSWRYCIHKIALYFRRIRYGQYNFDRELRENGEIFLPLPIGLRLSKLEEEFNILREISDNGTNNFNEINYQQFNDLDTLVTRLTVTLEYLKNSDDFNEIYKLINKSPIWEYVSFDLGRKISPTKDLIIWFEKITFGSDSDVGNWHTDTFYDSHKYWFFPYGIDNRNSIPMNYLKGSNKFNFNRIILEYWKSITIRKNTDLSWRIKTNSSFVRNHDIVSTVCSPNSTLIANVHGFHARAKVKSGSTRYQLHFAIR